jgi:putative hydrolase of HD superfamily
MDLLATIERLTAIERWNIVPHTNTWTEAESIALSGFIAYGLCTCMGMGHLERTNILKTILLYRLNVSNLSDISYDTLVEIKKIIKDDYRVFEKELNESVFSIFNRQTRERFLNHIDINYYNNSEYQDIIDFSSHIGAFYEICSNFDVYKDRNILTEETKSLFETDNELFFGYIKQEFNEHLFKKQYSSLLSIFSDKGFKLYFRHAHNLKYLKRWNSTLRRNQTSVLAHSFIVSILTLYFFELEDIPEEDLSSYLDRALLHDFPESFTGDIISPVKEALNKRIPNLSSLIEQRMTDSFLSKTNPKIKEALTKNNLLLEFFKDRNMIKIDNLVKDSDKLALIFECIFELKYWLRMPAMATACEDALSYLQKSQYDSIKSFSENIRCTYREIITPYR